MLRTWEHVRQKPKLVLGVRISSIYQEGFYLCPHSHWLVSSIKVSDWLRQPSNKHRLKPTQVTQLCPTHVLQQFNRASSRRGIFSTENSSRSVPQKFKGTLWDKVKGENFFAGGQTFQALPPSVNPKCNTNGGKLAALAQRRVFRLTPRRIIS